MRFLVSAGEASGDLYAASVVSHLQQALPSSHFFGCTGPRLRAQGVEPVIDAASLAVVGLAEVVGHLPRIYGQYRKLIERARCDRPDAALLTDSPDFHLRVARHLKRMKVPVYYLVAPQVWAWREGRVKTIRRVVDRLFCLFPFEEAWFRQRDVNAIYIGHPLATMVRTTRTKAEFFEQHGLQTNRQTVVLLPGSRTGEARRHLPDLFDAVVRLRKRFALNVVLAIPRGFSRSPASETFTEPAAALSIQIVENDAWNAIGHSDLALAASGTVTVEAAILGTPMVTFYKVNPLTWTAGRRLVRTPFLTMVNLIAGQEIVPELMQDQMNGESIARAATPLLDEPATADRMRAALQEVKKTLHSEGDPLARAAADIFRGCASAQQERIS